MSIKESALTAIQTIADTDFIRAVTSLGASRKVLASDVGKYVLEDYAETELNETQQTVQDAFTEVYESMSETNNELLEKLENAMITNSASGDIASFDDGSDVFPALSVVADIDPIQDLNGYDAPWVGGAGKNKFNASALSPTSTDGITLTISNGEITFNGTATANAYFGVYSLGLINSSGFALSFNNSATNSGVHIALRTSGGTYFGDSTASSVNKTLTSSTTDLNAIIIYVASGTQLTNFKIKPQVEFGQTPTAWQPYENICPISGWGSVESVVCGKNFFINNLTSGTTNQVTHTVNSDGSISLSGTASANCFLVCSQPYYLNGGTYTMRGSGNIGIQMQMRVNDATGSGKFNATTTNVTGSIDSGIYVSFISIASGTNCNGITLYPQLEKGNTITEYEHYGTTYTTSLGTTVYGGTLDVTTGELTEIRSGKLFSELSWELVSGYSHLFRTTGLINHRGTSGINYFCSAYNPVASSISVANMAHGECKGNANGSYESYFYVRDDNFSDAQTFAQSMATQTVVYTLATPTTTQLTATQVQTLLGTNHIFADSGDVSVEYKADTKLYIDNLIGTEEEDYVANEAISNGEVFSIGSRVFKATTTIAQGETITVGTNCVETSITEQINALYALV